MKEGALRSETYLAWIRRQGCFFCPKWPPSEPHHFPPKGMGGANIRDDWTIPVCRECHEQAQTYVIPPAAQRAAVADMRLRFLDRATAIEIETFLGEFLAWRKSRFDEFIPF